jgi:hypothetical protein
MQRTILRGLVCLVPLIPFASRADAQAPLRWKFTEGQKLYQEVHGHVKQTLSKPDAQLKSDTETTTLVCFTVDTKNADGSVVLKQKIESVKVNQTTGNQLGNIYKQMEGAELILTFNARMELTALEGYPALVKKISGNDPMVTAMIRLMISEDSLKQSAENGFLQVPDRVLNKGDRWDRKRSQTMGPLGSLNLTESYTHAGMQGDRVQLTLTAQAAHVPAKANEFGLPFQITKVDLKASNLKGTAEFDPSLGRLHQAETSIQVKGSITLVNQGQTTVYDVDHEETTRVRFLDKKPE